MTPRDAEKLLGGYATGTLTHAERRELFAAALVDQGLFDALADEEVLRELLADPQARARLLSVLAARPVVPWWRRPAVMGVAASLLVTVGLGLLLRYGPTPELPQTSSSRLSEETQPAPRMDKQTSPVKPSESPTKSRPPKTPPLLARKPEQLPRSTPEPAAAPLPSPAETQRGLLGKVERNSAEPSIADEARSKAAQAAVNVVGSQSAVDATTSQTGGAMSMSDLAAVPKGRSFSPQPKWAFSPMVDGHITLKIQWGPHGSLYLLRRNSAGVTVLHPSATATLPGGTKVSTFLLALATGDALDLYQLVGAVETPATLPEPGSAFAGFRARIWPVEKKTP